MVTSALQPLLRNIRNSGSVSLARNNQTCVFFYQSCPLGDDRTAANHSCGLYLIIAFGKFTIILGRLVTSAERSCGCDIMWS